MTNIFAVFFWALLFFVNSPSLASELDELDFALEKTTAINDPFESVNRKIFAFNDSFDRYLVAHITTAYTKIIPNFGQRRISDFLNNLKAPINLVNSALIGDIDGGLTSVSRFIVNSTLGIGGLFDLAGECGIKEKRRDFGMVMAYYGVKSGPYLVVPIFGPQTVRDGSSLLFDSAINPMGFNNLHIDMKINDSSTKYGITTLRMIDSRVKIESFINDMRSNSVDFYAAMRSSYLQNRQFDLESLNSEILTERGEISVK